MSVEEVCNKGEVETWVAGYEGGWCEVFSTIDIGCILEDLFCACAEVAGLKWGEGTLVGFELMEKDGVVFTVFDVTAEIVDAEIEEK